MNSRTTTERCMTIKKPTEVIVCRKLSLDYIFMSNNVGAL